MNLLLWLWLLRQQWLLSLMTHNLTQSQPIFTATVKNRRRRHTAERHKAQDPAISPRLRVTKSFLSPAFPAAPLEFSRLSARLSSACDKSFLAELERTRVGKRFIWQTARRPRSEQTKISSTGTKKKQQPAIQRGKTERDLLAFSCHSDCRWIMPARHESSECCQGSAGFLSAHLLTFFNLLRCE